MLKQLEELVSDDPKARRLYMEYLRDSIGLRYVVLPLKEKGLGTVASAADTETDISVNPSICLPLLGDLSRSQLPLRPPPRHGRLFLLGLAGGVSGGNGDFRDRALVGSHIYVSHPVQVAEQSASLPSPLSPLPSVVGRITGMVDCKWVAG